MFKKITIICIAMNIVSAGFTASKIIKETKVYIETENYYLYKHGKNKDVVSITDKNEGISNEELRYLLNYKDIRTIVLYGGYPYTDKTCEIISGFKSLKSLTIMNAKITDNGLKHIAGIDKLKKLTLENMLITDEGIKHLSSCENLMTLELKNTKVTDKSFETFSKIKNLCYIDLRGTKVTKEAAQVFYKKRVRELPNSDVHIFVDGHEFY